MKKKFHTGPKIDRPDRRRQWLSKSGIAGRYGISQRSVTNFMRRRVLPYVKIGRVVRFDVEACDRAMNRFQIRSVGADLP